MPLFPPSPPPPHVIFNPGPTPPPLVLTFARGTPSCNTHRAKWRNFLLSPPSPTWKRRSPPSTWGGLGPWARADVAHEVLLQCSVFLLPFCYSEALGAQRDALLCALRGSQVRFGWIGLERWEWPLKANQPTDRPPVLFTGKKRRRKKRILFFFLDKKIL